MAEIGSASRQQSAGIEQVNNSLKDMDGMTQQTTALVEEASAAAQEMQQQAATLAKVVGVFKLSVRDTDELKVRAKARPALRY